jgi:pilus assembly protein CpaB
MLRRNFVLVLGALLVFAGLGLSLVWMSEPGQQPVEPGQPQAAQAPREAVLEAAHSLPAGTLLRQEDLRWREIEPGQARPGSLLRSQNSGAEFYGAIIRRDFADGEALTSADLVKTTDRRFLSAVLRPGARAVSIAVDAPQSASGLVLPGDRVDVILTQNLGNAAGDSAHKTVAETVLRNVRIIALDQRLTAQSKGPQDGGASNEPPMPKTVTLELSEAEAQTLFVAAQLGGLQLSVRALEGPDRSAPSGETLSPTWAADVSPALRELSRPAPQALPSGSTIEALIRRPPAEGY